ncbi:unnamed protein product (macronuclear) [Paramecium tetraurelia]|uniref:IBB domain-containing protein n=1 Tax=Paramecium tetraurelia TaxID=5888 RepID=A0CH70_PARTE|nr:uncharacterized protein GSPATT00007577001 [Paramecium tetraurelia]CAK70137.1 unnamed protein product [Paramecium tetraurelia]|eukprot:XP_001437534.1 hypothetical protein (macronuclear) [Paramecium tetraurelia strain d4-2]
MNIVQKKREEFSINIRKQKREELFKSKRVSNTQYLPFSDTTTMLSEIYQNAYYQKQCPNNVQLNETIQKIFKISELADAFNQHDCEKNYDTSSDVEIIFDIIGKGYPVLDRACLQILLSFTLPSHLTCKPILKYIPTLLKFFNETQYEELKQTVLFIFSNLAADCYQCRDAILIYEIPQAVFQAIHQTTNELMNDLAQILINISRTQPLMSNFNQIQMIKLCWQLFPFLQGHEYIAGILQLIQKICLKDKNLLDMNFLSGICQDYSNSDLYLNEILALIKIMSYFDRNRYEQIENNILNFLIVKVNQILLNGNLDKHFQKQINKVLSIFTNMIVENPKLIFNALDTNIIQLFRFNEQLQETYDEIFCSIYYYSFYYQTINNLNQSQIKQFIQLFQPIQQMINLLDQNMNNQDIIIDILRILEMILQKDIESIAVFIKLNGEQYLAELSQHENEEVYKICEKIFEIIN